MTRITPQGDACALHAARRACERLGRLRLLSTLRHAAVSSAYALPVQANTLMRRLSPRQNAASVSVPWLRRQALAKRDSSAASPPQAVLGHCGATALQAIDRPHMQRLSQRCRDAPSCPHRSPARLYAGRLPQRRWR